MKLNAKRKKPLKRKIYNFKKADWQNLNNTFTLINWQNLLGNCSAETAWTRFKQKFMANCDRHIPKMSISNEFQPPWFDSDVYGLCRKKERLHKEWKGSSSDDKYIKFSNARREYKNLVDTKMNANFEDESNSNLINKKFWSFVKSKTNSHRIPEVVSYGDQVRSDPQSQCDLFNDFFRDQFTGVSDYSIDINFSNDHLYKINFEPLRIQNLLQNLDPNKAQGPDNVHGRILKSCSKSLATPLAYLYDLSYSTGNIPAEWKLANVVPIHKKGSKTDVSNYRPISLTSLIMKTYERVIREELLAKCHHLIDPRQHGFTNSKIMQYSACKFL